MVQFVNECPIIFGYKLLELLCSRVAADSNECTQVTMDEKFPIDSDFAQFQDFCLFVFIGGGSLK